MSFAEKVIADLRTREQRGALFLRSLAGRLTVVFLVASFLIVQLACGVLYWATVNALQWADDQVTEKRMEAVRTLLQDENPSDVLIAHEVSEDNQGPRQIFIRVIIQSETLAVETPDMSALLPVESFPDAQGLPFDTFRRATIKHADGSTYRALSVRIPVGASTEPKEAILQVATDTTLDKPALAWFRRLLGGVLASALLLCSVAGWLIVRRELEPLRRITTATSKISSMTLAHRLSLSGLPTELHQLGTEFNQMLERLESAYASLRHYADNVAHELRSPVNKMLLGTEIALSRERTSAKYREALESNMEECQSLARIVDSLLFLARAENTEVTLERRSADVLRELTLIRDFFDASASEAGVRLSVSCDHDLRSDVDRVLFQRAISNLVSNAIAHTPEGGAVSIRATGRDDGIAVEVADTGEGIPAEAQMHVFDRFFTVDRVRSPGSGRIGLGLPITKSIVALHGGTISLESAPKRGTRITFTLPASSPQTATAAAGADITIQSS